MPINQLSSNSLEGIALMLKALSDVTRLKIMQTLHQKEQCAGAIVAEVGTSQANISKHLQVLTQAHLIKSRREGNTVYYSLYGPFVSRLCDSICNGYAKMIEKKYGV